MCVIFDARRTTSSYPSSATPEIVGVYMGQRDKDGARGLWNSMPAVYRQCAVSYTDFCPFLWNSFAQKKTESSRKGYWSDQLYRKI